MLKQIFIKNNISYIILLNLLLLSFFILSSFRPIPDSTHYLVSIVNLDNFKNLDKINEIITFIRTPLYEIVSTVFTIPALYLSVSLLCNFILLNLTFFFFKSYFKDNGIPFFLVSTIIFLKFLILLSFFFNFEILNFSKYLIMNVDILNYFTIRQIFGIFYILILYCFIKNYYYGVCFFIFLNNFTHPNSNIFLICIFGLYFFYIFINDKKNLKYFLIFFISNLIYIIFVFNKINSFLTLEEFENSQYYLNLIRDEADDFSFLWTIAYDFKLIFVVYLLSILNLIFFLRKNKPNKITYLVILPLLIFIFGIIIEFINIHINIFFIENLIINLQPAWKILGYSFFPSLMIFGLNIKNIYKNNIIIFESSILLIALITTIIFFSFGLKRNYDELRNYLSYSLNTKKENNYEDWLKTHSYNNNYNFTPLISEQKVDYIKFNFSEKNIFKIKSRQDQMKININLSELYSFDESYALIKKVKELIPINNGLIIPPYFFNARGIFKDYAIFFVEHPDGNFAMGNFKFFKEIHSRMIMLFGSGYSKLPNKQTNLNYSYLRDKYLNINEKQLNLIHKKNNLFKYFITERNHILDFPIIFKNDNFLIYKII